jgi:hypothetical protein
VADFFSDFGCFGFLASRLDRRCPFAMTSSFVTVRAGLISLRLGSWGSLKLVRKFVIIQGCQFKLLANLKIGDRANSASQGGGAITIVRRWLHVRSFALSPSGGVD